MLLDAHGNPIESDGPEIHIPSAIFRKLYVADEVANLLKRLPRREHETLRSLYERMLKQWPNRLQVKPSSIPSAGYLYDEFPNFWEPLHHIRRSIALCHDTYDPLEIAPMLLLGPPWVGKTYFAREIARFLSTEMKFISMASLTAGWILSGASSQWTWSRPGQVFESLVDGQYANPVIVIDEIDKVRWEDAYDPLGALYSLLEHDTARNFIDEFAGVAIDASQVIWIATANDIRGIPEAILNRLIVYHIQPPTPEQCEKIAQKLYQEFRSSYNWWKRFPPELSPQALWMMRSISPRETRRALRIAFWNARLAERTMIEPIDFPKPEQKKIVGFGYWAPEWRNGGNKTVSQGGGSLILEPA